MTVTNECDIRLYDVIPFLPQEIASAVRLFCIKTPSLAHNVCEVRLRDNGALSLSCPDKSIFIDLLGNVRRMPYICSCGEISQCVQLLCRNSYHAHENEIKEGYISMPNGMRAGVAPNASLTGSVFGINSVCIRIPTYIEGCADGLLERTGEVSMLIYSPPGVGKTTLLKGLIAALSRRGRRVCVVDTRRELQAKKEPLADYLCGYPKGEGIELATRTLSPDFIVCDELGARDVDGVISCQNAGVPLIATCHGEELSTLLLRPCIKELYSMKVFSVYTGLSRCDGRFAFDIFKCDS